jgi:hypothetical protein
MEVEKTKSIDIPQNKKTDKKDISVSPTWSWVGIFNKPETYPPGEAVKLVTDPNILHHIKNAPKKSLKEVEDEVLFKMSEEEKSSESGNESNTEEEELLIPYKHSPLYYMVDQYSDDVKSACFEFKKSLMFDWNNIPTDVKIFGGAAITMCYNVFPHAAVLFLSYQVLEGVIEHKVRERIEQYEEFKRDQQEIIGSDFESSEEEEEQEEEQEEEEGEKEEKECV